ncbi:MAG: LLM class F420-dependent oxidoreductase [Actinobacteria bacterium]|nr:LLM class F420-dependent oxidoreductase [Actinomycetota bacterium]
MDLGIHFMNFSQPDTPAGTAVMLAAAAKAAEAGGCTKFTLMDHYFQMQGQGGPPEPMLEGYTSLGFLAAQTQKMTLGLLVTGVTYRHPGLLAKIVATLDVLSNGRAEFGIGAAWYEREHLGLGVPYPPVAERFERLDETIRICQQMWSDDDGPFEGKHYQLAETVCIPRPIQQPRPPILIGGGGERKTLRLVALYADACNLSGDLDTTARKLDVLRGHCDAVGRDYAAITKTLVTGAAIEDADAFVSLMASYARLGFSQVQVAPPADDPVGWIARVSETVVPRLGEIGE